MDEKVDNSGWRIKIVATCGYTHQIVVGVLSCRQDWIGSEWVPSGALLSRKEERREQSKGIIYERRIIFLLKIM